MAWPVPTRCIPLAPASYDTPGCVCHPGPGWFQRCPGPWQQPQCSDRPGSGSKLGAELPGTTTLLLPPPPLPLPLLPVREGDETAPPLARLRSLWLPLRMSLAVGGGQRKAAMMATAAWRRPSGPAKVTAALVSRPGLEVEETCWWSCGWVPRVKGDETPARTHARQRVKLYHCTVRVCIC